MEKVRERQSELEGNRALFLEVIINGHPLVNDLIQQSNLNSWSKNTLILR